MCFAKTITERDKLKYGRFPLHSYNQFHSLNESIINSFGLLLHNSLDMYKYTYTWVHMPIAFFLSLK